jgi:hypothetical protein
MMKVNPGSYALKLDISTFVFEVLNIMYAVFTRNSNSIRIIGFELV